MLTNIRTVFKKSLYKFSGDAALLQRNLYKPDGFQQQLYLEKQRAERLPYQFSIIVFDLENYRKSDSAKINKQYKIDLEYVTCKICAKIRKTDVVSFYKKNIILILLPDTGDPGARCVCKRLIMELIFVGQSLMPAKEFTSDDFNIEILSYPENFNIEKFPEVNFVSRTSANRNQMMDKPVNFNTMSKVEFKKEHLENLNLRVSSFNGSSIAVPIDDIFFWDQQIVSNFLSFSKKVIKRVIDIIGGIVGLTLLSPVFMLVSLLIKITSRGPVFFKQKRLGYQGKYFTFFKFRSMFTDCEDQVHQAYVEQLIQGKHQAINNGSGNKPFYKITEDSRVTPFGKFLRKASLDELPQFWNVLKGEMSLVGPRPPIPYEIKEYKNWHYRRILEVKPGITGLWQVSGRNRTTFNEMVRYDIYYAENWSLMLDIKILLKTFKAVFDGR